MNLLKLIHKCPTLTYKEYGLRLNISEATVKRLFNKLKSSKIVKREDSSRNGKWIINKKSLSFYKEPHYLNTMIM